ncbi:MAG: hypothetical protein R2824_22570 [Saprospiraceae bacterium]|nr:hypothetical protein [Lewinella sp.]
MLFTITTTNGPEYTAGLSADNKVHVEVMGDLPIQPAENSKLVFTWYCEHNLGSWTYGTGFDWNDYRIPYQGVYTMQAKIEYLREGKTRPYAAFWSNRISVHAL